MPHAEFADPQSLNPYSYVRNVPTRKIDPDGHRVVLDNTTDKDRKAAAARITKNLTPQERRMFKVGVNAQTHKTELQLKPNANVRGQHGTAFTRLVTEVNDQQHTASVGLQSTYTDPQTGQVQSVGNDAGGRNLETGIARRVNFHLPSCTPAICDSPRPPGCLGVAVFPCV
jgi:hypothetical protein